MATQRVPALEFPVQPIYPATNHTPGVRTFYVASESKPGTRYAVQYIRKPGMNRWQCSCPQFFFRCVARRRHCKHIHEVSRKAQAAHGVSRLGLSPSPAEVRPTLEWESRRRPSPQRQHRFSNSARLRASLRLEVNRVPS